MQRQAAADGDEYHRYHTIYYVVVDERERRPFCLLHVYISASFSTLKLTLVASATEWLVTRRDDDNSDGSSFFLALWPVDHHRPTNLRQYRYLVPYGTTIVPYHPPYRWPHAIISYHTIATPQSAQCRRTLPVLSPWDPVAWGSPSSCTIPFFFCSWPRSSLRCDNTKTLVTRF